MGVAERKSGVLTNMNREIASQAHERFVTGKYDLALNLLSQLGSRSSTGENEDLTLLHNKALCEYALTNFSNWTQFNKALLNLKKAFEIRTGCESNKPQDDDTGVRPSQSVSAAYQQSLPCSDSMASSAAGLANLDTDGSIVLYNLAGLHYQQMQYGASRAILEHLFDRIDSIDEPLAVHICFLLLDVLCITVRGGLDSEVERKRFSQQTTAILGILEKHHTINSIHNFCYESSSQKETQSTDDYQTSGASERSADQIEFLFRLHMYKAKILLLLRDHKPCKKEMKSVLEIFQRDLKDGLISTKADSLISTMHSPSSGGESGFQGVFSPVPPPSIQNVTALYLKANLEYLRDNYKKALKLLASCHGFQGSDEYAGPAEPAGPHYYNNMGCLHHKLGRNHAASLYFNKSLLAISEGLAKNYGSIASHSEPDGRIFGGITCEVLYNAGLQLLLIDQPVSALRCFERAALLFYNRPHLWLRMAECCMAEYHKNSQDRDKDYTSNLIRGIIGQPPNRRILLPVHNPRKFRRRPASQMSKDDTSVHTPMSLLYGNDFGNTPRKRISCSLESASHCLQNVIYLTSSNTRYESLKSILKGNAQNISKRLASRNPDVKDKENNGDIHEKSCMKPEPRNPICLSALLKLAYVHLELDDPIRALGFAQHIIADEWGESDMTVDPFRHPSELLLARIYAAEALIMQDKPIAALEILWPEEEQQLANTSEPSSNTYNAESNQDELSPNSLRTTLHLNLATIHILRNDIIAADRCLTSALKISPNSPLVLRLLAYLLLKRGSETEALAILKEGRISSGAKKV